MRFRYDKADQLLEAVRLGADGQPLHTTRFDYDALGRVVVETAIDHPTGCTHTLARAHDPLGNGIRTTRSELPGSPARNLHYLHYGSGHLHRVRLSLDQGEGLQQQSVWHVVADFERDDMHREILRTQGALTTRYQLDPLGRRLGSHAHRGTGLGVLPDDIPGISTHLPGAGIARLVKHYRYDGTGELREASHPLKGHARYDYDPTGRLDAVVRSATAQGGQPIAVTHYPSRSGDPFARIEREGEARKLAKGAAHDDGEPFQLQWIPPLRSASAPFLRQCGR